MGNGLLAGMLPSGFYGTPMIYRTGTGKQFVGVASDIGSEVALVAFSLDNTVSTQ
jgi:hypothetical protein